MMRGRRIQWLIALAGVFLWGTAVLHAQQCDDGNDCTANDMCSNGTCMGSFQAGGNCDDFNDCTINDRCQAAGFCGGDPAPVGTACGGGCGTCQQVVPIPGAPTECVGDASNMGKACDPGINPCLEGQCQIITMGFAFCLPQLKQCPDSGSCQGACNPATGQCEANLSRCVAGCEVCNAGVCEPANIGAACNDSNVCTTQSSCQPVPVNGVTRGLCLAGTPSVSNPTPTATTPSTTPTVPPTPPACVGDCNDDKQVAVNEMIIGVNILLGSAQISQCPAFDTDGNNMVEVNELISGVNALLNGCE